MSSRPPRIWARFLVLLLIAGGLAAGLYAIGLSLWLAIPIGAVGGFVLFLVLLALFDDPGGCVPPPPPHEPGLRRDPD